MLLGFIFRLHEAYKSGSFVDAINAFKLYVDIDPKKLNHTMLWEIITIIKDTFVGLTDTSSPVKVIENFNNKLNELKNENLKISLFGESFCVTVFDEYDLNNNKAIVSNLSALTWATSLKLFTEVFSPESKYMTVHQAKGLEWDKVIVSLNPNNFDKIKLPIVYSNPEILKEEAADEFVRMYYVACSRARESLYIHLPSGFDQNVITTALNGRNISYEIII